VRWMNGEAEGGWGGGGVKITFPLNYIFLPIDLSMVQALQVSSIREPYGVRGKGFT